jgi:hypothetical protein
MEDKKRAEEMYYKEIASFLEDNNIGMMVFPNELAADLAKRLTMLEFAKSSEALPSEQMKEAEVIISTLMAYGKIYTVRGVTYAAGSHEDMINRAENWLGFNRLQGGK